LRSSRSEGFEASKKQAKDQKKNGKQLKYSIATAAAIASIQNI